MVSDVRTEPHRLTATLCPFAMMTLYTSADEPLPITSSLMMSPARHSTAHHTGAGVDLLTDSNASAREDQTTERQQYTQQHR